MEQDYILKNEWFIQKPYLVVRAITLLNQCFCRCVIVSCVYNTRQACSRIVFQCVILQNVSLEEVKLFMCVLTTLLWINCWLPVSLWQLLTWTVPSGWDASRHLFKFTISCNSVYTKAWLPPWLWQRATRTFPWCPHESRQKFLVASLIYKRF